MADLLRSQNIARAQQQQQQQFSLGLPQLSASSTTIQQNFHDQPSQHQNLPPRNFSNMGFQNPSMHGQSLNSGMLNPFQNGQGQSVSRQLELLANHRLQQQQHQAGLNGQSGMNQRVQPDIFSPPTLSNEAVRRPSPHPPSQPHGVMNQQSTVPQNANRGSIAAEQIQTKLVASTESMANLEAQIHQLLQTRAGMSDAAFAARQRHLQDDLARKRDTHAKLTHLLNAVHSTLNNQ